MSGEKNIPDEMDSSAIDHEVAKESTATSSDTTGTPPNGGADAAAHDIKEENDLEVQKEEAEGNGPPSNVEYPSGFRLVAIVIALILSIFLVALDMTVRLRLLHACFAQYLANTMSTDCRYGHSANHGPIPFPEPSRLVWQRIFLDRCRLSKHVG